MTARSVERGSGEPSRQPLRRKSADQSIVRHAGTIPARQYPLGDDLIKLVAERLALLADPVRLRILDVVRSGPRCVAEIDKSVPTTQQNVSKHLGRLYRAGILTRRRAGVRQLYELVSPTSVHVVDAVAAEVTHEVDALAQRVRGERNRT
jgi:DNA-binding transcriptional ArsR family regulator